MNNIGKHIEQWLIVLVVICLMLGVSLAVTLGLAVKYIVG